MRLSFNKLVFAAAVCAALAAGAALPAAAAQPAAIELPSITWPWSGVAAEGIEPGDYAATMTVGETQQLAPVLTPANATTTVTYVSENETVAAVSSSGLVQAVSAGTTRIAAAAGDYVAYYTITVQTDPSTWVSEMDITLSASQIAVGDSASISIQVLPSNASNTSELTLASSDTSVATVNNFGKVTGVAPGTATITATCGSVSASAKITVVGSASGETITLNTNYVVLKPGATATIKGTVSPSSAAQSLTFKTGDSSVAAVSSSGVITATGTGATSIIVSNGTASALVTVIVNRTATPPADDSSSSGDTPSDDTTATDPVVQAIESVAGTEVTLSQSEVPTLTTDILSALRTSGKTLVLTAENYTMRINGADITNTSNTISTALVFTAADNGTEFELESSTGSLPGDVEITLTGSEASYKRLYLYNGATGKWQYLNTYSAGVFDADTAGRYLLTNETLNTIGVSWFFLGAAVVVVAAIGVVYIVFKKRYWFW